MAQFVCRCLSWLLLIYPFCLIPAGLYGQQELACYDLTDSWYTRALNPGIIPGERKFHLGLLSTGVEIRNNTQVSVQDLSTYFGGGQTEEASQMFLDRLNSRPGLASDQRLEGLSFGFRLKGKFFISVMHAYRLHAGAEVPRELPELILLGNDRVTFWDKSVNLAPAIRGSAWQEFRLALSKTAGNLTVGAGLNCLLGISAAESDPNLSDISIYTDPANLRLYADNHYRFRTANLLETFSLYDLRPEFTTVQFGSSNPFSPGLIAGNGFALDAGLSWRVSKWLLLSGSVLDYGGRINWKKNTYAFTVDKQYIYDGGEIAAEALLNGADGLELSDIAQAALNESFAFERTEEAFSTTLPTRYYARMTLRLSGAVGINLSYFRQEQALLTQDAFSAGLRLKPAKWLSLGLLAVYGEEARPQLGASLLLSPGPVQLFLATDNLESFKHPELATRINFRAGLSLAFGKPPKEEKKEAFEKKESNQF